MSVTVQITKCFHRDILAFDRGMTHNETMTFVNFDDADDWARRVNENHLINEYHITNIWMDDGNWIAFDISKIWDAAGDDFAAEYRKHNPRQW